MPTATSITAGLKKKGSEQARKIYARHGMPADRVFGASIADLKAVAKTIKGEHALACELYEKGIMETMYLAGLVADGSQMTKKQLNAWAERAAGFQMISEYTVPWVTVDSAYARDLAIEWIKSKKEHVASSGWCAYAGIIATQPDDALNLPEIEDLLNTVVKGIHSAPNRVRYTMNGFVIAVGTYVKPLLKQAKAAAQKIGNVSVDLGDTACKVPLASVAIDKAAARLGQKRKTIRC